jgi:hypothetical protein
MLESPRKSNTQKLHPDTDVETTAEPNTCTPTTIVRLSAIQEDSQDPKRKSRRSSQTPKAPLTLGQRCNLLGQWCKKHWCSITVFFILVL